ncbi:GntR family transcriptional regulator [Variovorax sp. Root318D1]|uniref:FadR/GntR family transcriptional regulator n=1 Tax=Variovorax sp. Root318D1 TaxID=1736513 RepID=UPI0007016404|nr:FadR/GntR family transcriptional regulator [Variovorax sp. Root318D1]KQU82920.1 GntR family transcriptional regulator [Variovorax sp. Root318D1]
MTARFQSVAPTVRLADQVADALAAEVRSGRLSEGDRLPTEAALAEQFGVSRTVVREAVSRLKSLGLLDSRQGSGVYVRAAGVEPLRFEMPHVASREAVIQMVELRRALEAEVAALAAERRTPEDVQRIRDAIDSLHAAVAAGGNGADEDVRFHRAIAEAARNPFLIGTLQYLRQFLHGATRVTRANEARRADFARQVAQEHAQIVEAIEAGDPLRAREAAKSHMDNAIRRIEQADPVFWQQEGAQLARPLVEGWPAGK